MEELTSCFSTLYSVLQPALEETIFTCNILQTHCSYHRTLLKRWSLHYKEIHECSCKSAEESDEFVNNIVDVVAKAKATRNITKKKVIAKQNCLKDATSDDKCARKSKQKLPLEKLGDRNKNHSASMNYSLKAESDVASTQKGKLGFCVAMKKHSFQTTYQKDFSSKKLGFKHVQMKKTKYEQNQSSSIVSEKSVEYLLHNVTSSLCELNTTSIQKPDNTLGNLCKIHSEGASVPVYRSLKEAINMQGVPPDLLKLLSPFHWFLKTYSSDTVNTKACGTSYLWKLNESNEKMFDETSEAVVKLCIKSLILMKNILSMKRKDIHENNLAELEKDMTSLRRIFFKMCGNDLCPFTHTLCTKKTILGERMKEMVESQRSLIGVWRRQYNVSGLGSYPFLIYKTKDDCKLLQENFQKIQKFQFQNEVLATLNDLVFPALNCVERESTIICNIYKMCKALCDVSTLSMPVILKT